VWQNRHEQQQVYRGDDYRCRIQTEMRTQLVPDYPQRTDKTRPA